MHKSRLEAFSDGVIAIIITIMVLELKVPHGADLAALAPLVPVFLGYVLSFIYVGIYWNNHHHLFQAAQRVNGTILWANLHLLFWLSLIPFVTGWMGENHFAAVPTALYGVVLLMAALAYRILQCALVSEHGRDSLISTALDAVRGRGVYRLLKALTDSDIVVDVISGTSAGGINGIMLSYALCNGCEFATSADLWRMHGDLAKLLRPLHDDPDKATSLLNSEGYYQEGLEKVFRQMTACGGNRQEDPSPVRELDLFVTSTDVDGHLHAVRRRRPSHRREGSPRGL